MKRPTGRDSAWGHYFLSGIGLSLALLTVSCGGPGSASGSRLIDATTDVLSGRGTVVFTDDFHDQGSGWTTETLPSGAHFAYSKEGYVVIAIGGLHHFAFSPFQWPEQQLSARVTATLSSGAALTGGFGIGCFRGTGTSEIRYELFVGANGRFFVERADGAPSLYVRPTLLKQGTSTSSPGTTPLTIEGMCATLRGGQTTRLVLFVGGQRVADIADTADSLPGQGWVAELVVLSSASAHSTVTVTNFTERDASH
jgi:hypothetical protein